MLKQIPRVLLLVGLVSAIVVSSAPARGSDANCACSCGFAPCKGTHHCEFDKQSSQCINTTCPGFCVMLG